MLKIPFRATIALQKQDLTLTDAFGIWIKMKIHFEICNKRAFFKTNLSKHLLNAFEKRKQNVFSNPFMKSALFLDPRYRGEILKNREAIEEAKRTLVKLWHRINFSDNTFHSSETLNINDDPNVDPFDITI